MLTALLLLLGLSGAGAGLYSVLKNSPTGNDPGGEGFRSSSRGSGSGSGPGHKSDARGDLGSSKSGGRQKSRGEELPFGRGESDSKPANQRENTSDPKGTGPGFENSESRPWENLPLGELGDQEKDGKGWENMGDSPLPVGKPRISYPVDEIISKNSKYSHHRRPILTAEALVDKENLDGAIEIYQRTASRIPDEEIKKKIDQNIQDLKKFQKEKEKAKDWADSQDPGSDDLQTFRPSSPIPIRDLAEAIKEIAEALTESLQRGFYPVASPNSPIPPPSEPRAGMPDLPQDSGRQLPPGYFPPPVVYQIVSAGPGTASPPPSLPQGFPGSVTEPTSLPVSINYQPVPPVPPAIPGTPDEHQLDLPEDTFFTREWDKFKDLPLLDRRSGKERRQLKDRRSGPDRKDRRSGFDRRKEDLFKLREEYLKKKAEEKIEYASNEFQPDPSLSDSLAPHYPPPNWAIPDPGLTEIDLPDPEDFYIGTGSDPSPGSTGGMGLSPINLPNPEEIGIPIQEVKEESSRPQELEINPEWKLPDIPSPTAKPESKQLDLPKIGLPDPEDIYNADRDGVLQRPPVPGDPESMEDLDAPEIEVVDGDLDEQLGEIQPEKEEEAEPEKIIHGVLELKPPEIDDAPFLTLTYDFSKIPHGYKLSKNYSIMEYSYYKYKPMLMKAQEFARRKMLKNALNYYRVIKSQNIPPEMRKMINRNIRDITEFMEKFLMAKGG